MYDLPVSYSDLFPSLDFFVKSKLILGLFSKKLFDHMAFSCLFSSHFCCLIDTNLKGNKIYVINTY